MNTQLTACFSVIIQSLPLQLVCVDCCAPAVQPTRSSFPLRARSLLDAGNVRASHLLLDLATHGLALRDDDRSFHLWHVERLTGPAERAREAKLQLKAVAVDGARIDPVAASDGRQVLVHGQHKVSQPVKHISS